MPTVEEQLSNLTVSVDALRAAVLIKRSELDAAVESVSAVNVANTVATIIETSNTIQDAIDSALMASNKISSNTAPVGGSTQITNIIAVTQAQYDSLDIKSASTIYVII